MNNQPTYILSCHRAIAYALLISQFLTSCGSPIPSPQLAHPPVLADIPEDTAEASGNVPNDCLHSAQARLQQTVERTRAYTKPYTACLKAKIAAGREAHNRLWDTVNSLHEVSVAPNDNDEVASPWLSNCQQPITRIVHRTGIKPLKLLLVGGICPALLCMTSLPYWQHFQIDDTPCHDPARSCTIVAESFSLTTLSPSTLSEDLNASNTSLAFYSHKAEELFSAWYQQHPCSDALLQADNESGTGVAVPLYQNDPTSLANYLDCAREQGQARSNETDRLLIYLATQSRENPEPANPALDSIVREIRSQFNKDMQMQLGELHRLQANDMGVNIEKTKAFNEETAARIQRTTTNIVSVLSFTWHVVTSLFAFAAVIYLSKMFLKQGSIVEKKEGGEIIPKQLSYNTTLFHSLPLCITGSLLALSLCAYLQHREILDATYTLHPATHVILDTSMLLTAFWGMYNMELSSNINVERVFAGLSLASTAIWFPSLVLHASVHAPLNCNESGSLAALASKHNNLLNMLQVITSNGFTEKILEMVMPHFAEQLQQAAVPDVQLPTWCTRNESLTTALLINAHVVLYLYVLSIAVNQAHTLWRGYTHNSWVFCSKIMWLARCIFSYDQAILNFPFVKVSRSLPLPGMLEAVTMATLLASAVLVDYPKAPTQKLAIAEPTQASMGLAASQGTVVMGAANSMTSTASSISSVVSSLDTSFSLSRRRFSDAFQRMISGL